MCARGISYCYADFQQSEPLMLHEVQCKCSNKHNNENKNTDESTKDSNSSKYSFAAVS